MNPAAVGFKPHSARSAEGSIHSIDALILPSKDRIVDTTLIE